MALPPPTTTLCLPVARPSSRPATGLAQRHRRPAARASDPGGKDTQAGHSTWCCVAPPEGPRARGGAELPAGQQLVVSPGLSRQAQRGLLAEQSEERRVEQVVERVAERVAERQAERQAKRVAELVIGPVAEQAAELLAVRLSERVAKQVAEQREQQPRAAVSSTATEHKAVGPVSAAQRLAELQQRMAKLEAQADKNPASDFEKDFDARFTRACLYVLLLIIAGLLVTWFALSFP